MVASPNHITLRQRKWPGGDVFKQYLQVRGYGFYCIVWRSICLADKLNFRQGLCHERP